MQSFDGATKFKKSWEAALEAKVEVIRKALKEARTTLSEHESKELLQTYGIRIPALAHTVTSRVPQDFAPFNPPRS